MVHLQGTITGLDAFARTLRALPERIIKGAQAGLDEAAGEVHAEALQNLSGAGAVYETRTSRTGKQSRKKIADTTSGGYPVPRRTAWLAQNLDFVPTGTSKRGVRTGQLEAIIYDSAEYAVPIHEGTGSSAKFGPRRFIVDAVKKVNVRERVEEGIRKETGA